MVEKKENKKKKSPLLWFIFGLTIGCLVSFVFLASFLVDYAEKSTIPVVKVDITNDEDKIINDKNNGENDKNTGEDAGTIVEEYYNLKPGFKVEDAEQTWVSQNNVSIFKISYDNETGETTVSGTGNNKVIAPGTTNSYYFDLINTGNTGLDYQVSMKAYLSDNITSIPVEVKLNDHTGKYIVGTETSWENVSSMNDVVEEGKLSEDHKARYVFSWQWPYESGNDEYDTYLGNLAVNEDVTLTVEIKTLATGNSGVAGGIPTGDNTDIAIYVAIGGISCAAMLFLVILGKKDKDDEEKN